MRARISHRQACGADWCLAEHLVTTSDGVNPRERSHRAGCGLMGIPKFHKFETGLLVRAGTVVACSSYGFKWRAPQKSREEPRATTESAPFRNREELRATTESPKSRGLGLLCIQAKEDADDEDRFRLLGRAACYQKVGIVRWLCASM